MKILICASAGVEIVKKCIREFEKQGEVTVIAPSPGYVGLSEFFDSEKVSVIELKGNSFNSVSTEGLKQVKDILFDEAVILSGGLGFVGFDNVIETIHCLRIKKCIFYNKTGHKEAVKVPAGAGRVLEKYGVALLLGFFGVIRPVELLMERIYIRCAELLDL